MTGDGRPHGPKPNTTSCLQHLSSYNDGDTIRLEPFRSGAFRVVKDLIVDRSALDRIIESGGFVTVDAGTAPDADVMLNDHETTELALDFAACIGCGACVAACPNGSAQLFAGAKLSHLARTIQGKEERSRRAQAIARQIDEDFGPCSIYGECATVCPAGIPLGAIAAVNKERIRSLFFKK